MDQDTTEKDFKEGYGKEEEYVTRPPEKQSPPTDEERAIMFLRNAYEDKETPDKKEIKAALETILNKDEISNKEVGKLVSEAVGEKQAPPSNKDYDYVGYEQALKEGKIKAREGEDAHYPDTFKMPSHITFSDQSQYSNEFEKGGKWISGGKDQNLFIPSEHNLKNTSPEKLAEHFSNYEKKGTYILLPDGTTVEGSK
jgi:hypothetical protein